MSVINAARSIFSRSLFESDLPDGWRLTTVGEALTDTQYGLSEAVDKAGSTPIVGMRDLRGGVVTLVDLATVGGGEADRSAMRLRKGDILLNRTNSPDLVGKVGIVREDTEAVFASYLVRLKVNSRLADPEFVNYWLNSDIAQRALKRLSTRGVSQANINPTEFRKYCPFPLTDLTTQRKIAEILRTWDKAIQGCTSLIELREKQYKGLRELLIDWESGKKRPLRRVLSSVSRKIRRPNDPYRALSIRSHGKGTFERFVDHPESVAMEHLFIAKAGDLIVNITFAWEGAVALVPDEHDGGLVSHRFPTFEPNTKDVNPHYLRHALRMSRFTFLLGVASPGGAGRNRVLNKRDFLDLEIPLPAKSDQDRIAKILDNAEHATTIERQYLNALEHQKRGLMQKLLTGEWPVVGDAKAAE